MNWGGCPNRKERKTYLRGQFFDWLYRDTQCRHYALGKKKRYRWEGRGANVITNLNGIRRLSLKNAKKK